jgi:hypothetical protein
MLNKLLFASLIALPFTATAAPEPQPVVPNARKIALPLPVCTATGPVLFQSTTRFQYKPIAGLPLAVTTLYDSGAWTFVETTDGKRTRVASGCLPHPDLVTIDHDLRKSTWKLDYNVVTCAAIGATAVDFASHGTPLFTETVCGPARLDDASTKSLAEINAILAKVTAAKS